MGLSTESALKWLRHAARDVPHWGRVVMNRDIDEGLRALDVARLDALEISGWAHRARGWRSYRQTQFPEFDLCTSEALRPEVDVVFCEQVLEHVPDPVRAVKNLYALLRPGGLLVVSVPFMVRIHNEPGDYWRFSPQGLRELLSRQGFVVERCDGWGSRLSVIANLWVWMPYLPRLLPLSRAEATPLVVWALARKPS